MTTPRGRGRRARRIALWFLATLGPIVTPLWGQTFGLRWNWDSLGPAPGRFGLAVRDLDGDGSPEIVASGCSWTCWVVESRIGSEYVETAGSLPAETIDALALAGSSAWGGWAVVAVGQGTLRIYPEGDPVPAASFAVGYAAVDDLEVADVDGDGHLEVVAVGDAGVWVRDLESGALESASPADVGVALSIGQADDDPALEIAVASGTGSLVLLDGATLGVDWSEPTLGGRDVLLVDLDGNGRDEVVTSALWSGNDVRAFDPRTSQLLFDVPLGDVPPLRLAAGDLTGDARPEIVVSDDEYGGLHVLDGTDGHELWSLSRYDLVLNQMALADLDGDGSLELAWSTSFGPDLGHLGVSSPLTGETEWVSRDLQGGFPSLGGGAVTGDARHELLATGIDNDLDDSGPRLLTFRAGDGRLLSSLPLPFDSELPPVFGLAQLDGDAALELVILSRFRSGSWPQDLRCLDARTLDPQWQVSLYGGFRFGPLALGDVDGDGETEAVLGGTFGVHSYVVSFDASTGFLRWASPDLGLAANGFGLLALADLDGDGRAETVLSNLNTSLAVTDGASGDSTVLPSYPYSALAGLPVGGPPDTVLAARRYTGELGVVDPATGSFQPTYGDWGTTVSRLALADVLGDAAPELLFVADQVLTVVDPSTFEILWQSPPLGVGTASAEGLAVVDLDGDGSLEVAVDLGDGIAVFGRPYAGNVLLIDGFESGDVSGWSRAAL
jgi:hypothetical protein